MTRWRRTTACERAAQWISLDLDGELGRLEQAALVRHLHRCDRCRASSFEIGGFTGLLRAAPPVEPARAIVVPTPAWAKRRARATLRGGALALAAAAAIFAAMTALSTESTEGGSSLGFGGETEQIVFAREHVLNEPTLFAVEVPPAHSFADRALL
jgi:predicted anti-sigma-YlaC factor YlaD